MTPPRPDATTAGDLRRHHDPPTRSSDPEPSPRVRARRSLEQRLSRPAPTVWLSGQEAAEYVGVSWPTLRQALIEHAIPYVRLGTRWKIDVAVLDHHLHRLAEAEAGLQ